MMRRVTSAPCMSHCQQVARCVPNPLRLKLPAYAGVGRGHTMSVFIGFVALIIVGAIIFFGWLLWDEFF